MITKQQLAAVLALTALVGTAQAAPIEPYKLYQALLKMSW